MNLKTLVVGDKVRMVSSRVYGAEGVVIKITPEGVEVQSDQQQLFRFDTSGVELDSSRSTRIGFGPDGTKFHNFLWYSAPECQPYELLEKIYEH
jgi:hypothetical protein